MLLRKIYYLKKSFQTLRYGPKKLRKLQTRLIKEVLEQAYDSFSFYSSKWDAAGFSLNEFNKLEDMSKVPITGSDEFRDSMGRTEALPQESGDSHLSTSGSSGREPLVVDYNDQGWDWLEAVYLRSLMLNGYQLREPQSYYWYKEFDRGFFENWMVPKQPIHMGLSLDQQLDALEEQDNNCIVYYPQVLFSLAKKVLQSNRKLAINPLCIITQGELVTPHMRDTIERVFGAQVYDHYGSTEFNNRIAWECPDADGYHLASDSVFIEILDEKGEPVEPGEPGKIVGTSLVNLKTPVVRYSLGDVVVPTEKDCSCQTTFPMISEIKGRKEDIIYNSQGEEVFPRDIVDLLASFPDLLMFEFIREGEDDYVVKYVPNQEFDAKTLPEIKRKFAENLGVYNVSFEEVDEPERTSGGKLNPVKTGSEG